MERQGSNPISVTEPLSVTRFFFGWRALNGVTRRNFSSLGDHHTTPTPMPIHVNTTEPVATTRLPAQRKRYSNALVQFATLIPLTRYDQQRSTLIQKHPFAHVARAME